MTVTTTTAREPRSPTRSPPGRTRSGCGRPTRTAAAAAPRPPSRRPPPNRSRTSSCAGHRRIRRSASRLRSSRSATGAMPRSPVWRWTATATASTRSTARSPPGRRRGRTRTSRSTPPGGAPCARASRRRTAAWPWRPRRSRLGRPSPGRGWPRSPSSTHPGSAGRPRLYLQLTKDSPVTYEFDMDGDGQFDDHPTPTGEQRGFTSTFDDADRRTFSVRVKGASGLDLPAQCPGRRARGEPGAPRCRVAASRASRAVGA